jgi:hypothetical protein
MNNPPADLPLEYVPSGYRLTFIICALLKRALLAADLKVGYRLRFLEAMNHWTDNYFRAEMLQMIDPMSDLEYAIYKEAKSLDSEDKHLSPTQRTEVSFKLLTGERVFSHFLKLNRGIAAAIKWHDGLYKPDAAIPPAHNSLPEPPAQPRSVQCMRSLGARNNG